jgi:hypothetical protein
MWLPLILLILSTPSSLSQLCSLVTESSSCSNGCTWCPEVNIVDAPTTVSPSPSPSPATTAAATTAVTSTGSVTPTFQPQSPSLPPNAPSTAEATPVPTVQPTVDPSTPPTIPPPVPPSDPPTLPPTSGGNTPCSSITTCTKCGQTTGRCCWLAEDRAKGQDAECVGSIAGPVGCTFECNDEKRQAETMFRCVSDAECASVVVNDGSSSSTGGKAGEGGEGGGGGGAGTIVLVIAVVVGLAVLLLVAVVLLSKRRRRRAAVPVPTSQRQQEPRRTTSRSVMRRSSQSRVNAHVTPVRPPGTGTASYHYPTVGTSSTSPSYDSPSSPLQSGFSKYSTQSSANSYVQPMESFYS